MRVQALRWLLAGAVIALLSTACTATAAGDTTAPPSAETPTTAPDVEVPSALPTPPEAEAPTTEVEPQPFVPTGPVGSATDYNDLVAELAALVPPGLRSEVPWPDLRNPDPVRAQLDIFELWIWMAENHPEPLLAPIMAQGGSPSRENIAGIFGTQAANDQLVVREQEPYRAFDHRVVTFETAGLPLWLARDVPDDAVVVYYKDNSGPVTVYDRTSGEPTDGSGAVPTRQWLSIMVPTEVGWLLFRDQLIEPTDLDLPVPEVVPSEPETRQQDL